MSVPSIQKLELESLHVYRRLLRAATYLPDSFARMYMHNHIVSRFKHHSKKNRSAQTTTEQQREHKLATTRVKNARTDARVLEKAGYGSVDDLKKVLLEVHGRKGKRKRELIKDLLRSDEHSIPANNAMLEKLYNGSEKETVGFVPGPKFDIFLKSQQANPPLEHPKYRIKHLSAIIPKENLWQRPMPQKRQVNLRKRWWAYTLDKLLPPVPYEEWNRLKALATGSEHALEITRPRRTPVPCLTKTSSNDKELGILGDLMAPIRQTYNHVSAFNIDSTGKLSRLGVDQPVEKPPYQLTHRSLQRLYATIWNMTATMSFNLQTGKWDVKWGGQKTPALDGQFTKASQKDEELFVEFNSSTRPKRKIDTFLHLRNGQTSSVEVDKR